MKELIKNFPISGTVDWIGIRPEKKGKVHEKIRISVNPDEGIVGDHYHGRNGKRHVTLIQKEHLDVVASLLKKEKISPALLRRNIVISGINLTALKGSEIKIGNSVLLEVTGICAPCSRMEENLGKGGYNAMRGHGGMTARVISDGEIKIGDEVKPDNS